MRRRFLEMTPRKHSCNFGNSSEFLHSRGYIPHYEAVERVQMITYRLHDSLPATVLAQLEEQLKDIPFAQQQSKRRQQIEQHLDNGKGSCHLQNRVIASIVEQNILHFDQMRYKLHAWVLMPNHVHVLLTPHNGILLSEIVHTWKSYTAKKANAILGRTSSFWQQEYFDRMIRNEKHYYAAIEYIHNNPVKAGLCKASTEWDFGSAKLLLNNKTSKLRKEIDLQQ
jgi:putative DNA methylase